MYVAASDLPGHGIAMRQKTDQRRRAIIEVAAGIFRDLGYARATMSRIALAIGGSKATLYSYFESKDELFAAVAADVIEVQGRSVLQLLEGKGEDVPTRLSRFGLAYLELFTTKNVLAIDRIVISESCTSGLTALLYDRGLRQGWACVETTIGRWMDEGLLAPGDSFLATMHLKALLEAGIREPALFGAAPDLTIEQGTAAAVVAFMRLYGPG